jgi:hypothetical protein
MGLFHRCSIGRLLAIVAILAVNLAAWRALSDIAPSLPFGFALSGPVLQVGLFCLVGSRGRVRGFWFGFVMAGLAAASSHIYLFVPGALFQHVWSEYTWRAHYVMASINITSTGRYRGDAVYPVAIALIQGLPQLLIALAGGMLAWLISAGATSANYNWRHFRARDFEGAEADR